MVRNIRNALGATLLLFAATAQAQPHSEEGCPEARANVAATSGAKVDASRSEPSSMRMIPDRAEVPVVVTGERRVTLQVGL